MMLMKFWFGRRLKGRCRDATAMDNDFIRFCGIDGKLNVGISEGCWICGFHVSNVASNKILRFSGFKISVESGEVLPSLDKVLVGTEGSRVGEEVG